MAPMKPADRLSRPEPPPPRKSAIRTNGRPRTGGPKTAEGKARSSHNKIRHGLTALTDQLIPGEAQADWEAFRVEFRTHMAPSGPVEAMLVDRVAMLFWRLQRVGRVEAGLYTWGLEGAEMARSVAEQYSRSLVPAGGLQPASKETLVGQGFVRLAVDPDAWTTLSGYERAIEGSLYRALDTLERLQAARKAKPRPQPAEVDGEATEIE